MTPLTGKLPLPVSMCLALPLLQGLDFPLFSLLVTLAWTQNMTSWADTSWQTVFYCSFKFYFIYLGGWRPYLEILSGYTEPCALRGHFLKFWGSVMRILIQSILGIFLAHFAHAQAHFQPGRYLKEECGFHFLCSFLPLDRRTARFNHSCSSSSWISNKRILGNDQLYNSPWPKEINTMPPDNKVGFASCCSENND